MSGIIHNKKSGSIRTAFFVVREHVCRLQLPKEKQTFNPPINTKR